MPTKPLLFKPIKYRNVAYSFSITFPRWWDSYTVVDKTTCSDEPETTISFRFRYRGRVYDPIVTLIITPFNTAEWHHAYADSPLVYLGEHEGRTYAYILPEELPDAFLRSDKQDYDYQRYGRQIKLLKAMVAQAPLVMKSFAFFPSTSS
ncbi:hypothetical protein ACFFK0_27735 [Paenibacillus chartarius]|uniref:Uncharacterized protein n=1 Tax=Paenibacillus chartarius TaxID=747481 RepID=A0ABV6DU54_9BACL